MALNGWASRIRTYEWRSQSPLPYRLAIAQNEKKGQYLVHHLNLIKIMVEGGRFELPNPKERIYSPPRLATSLPLRLLRVPARGLEPPTYWLQVSCSTNWATPAWYLGDFISSIYYFKIIMVAQDGIEPPTQGFSVLCSTDWATEPTSSM